MTRGLWVEEESMAAVMRLRRWASAKVRKASALWEKRSCLGFSRRDWPAAEAVTSREYPSRPPKRAREHREPALGGEAHNAGGQDGIAKIAPVGMERSAREDLEGHGPPVGQGLAAVVERRRRPARRR